MSCYGCSRKYGLFCKEYGCPNCGYSYCSKCLKKPIAVPRHSNKVLNVCLICYSKLSQSRLHDDKVIDVETLPATDSKANAKLDKDINALLELEPSAALIGDILEPITSNKTSNLQQTNIENADIIENLDTALEGRLRKLKLTTDELPTDAALRSRLANLRDIPEKNYSKKDLLLETDKRSDREKMNDLLQQFMGEVELDQRLQTENDSKLYEIENRLKALREHPTDNNIDSNINTNTNTPSDNELDEEAAVKAVIERSLAESKLPTVSDDNVEDNPAHDTEELPWCIICNEDATFRCIDCEGQLFCRQCFRECHADDDDEYRYHVKQEYSVPFKFKEQHF